MEDSEIVRKLMKILGVERSKIVDKVKELKNEINKK